MIATAERQTDTAPRVACLITAYYPRSHADVLVTRLLAGDYTYPQPADPSKYDADVAARELAEFPLPHDAAGSLLTPRLKVASLYVDQFPSNDIGRAWAARAGVPIYPSVREALTLGGDRLAVDAVLIIGEHGDYPRNERGQKQYPRRRFFEQAVAVFRESGRVVPVFVDKHLSAAWADAKWMVDTARAMDIPLMAGSQRTSVPIEWRKPPLVLPLGCVVHDALVVAWGPVEDYGFHALEALQCMVERRGAARGRGGETGVAAVQCLSGEAAWQAADGGHWDRGLLAAALAPLVYRTPGDPRQIAVDPVVFLLRYRDGLHAAVCLLNGVVKELGFAARITPPVSSAADTVQAGETIETVATRWIHHSYEPYGHHAYVLERIHELVETNRAPRPIERTLLTTGVLDRLMESRWRGGVPLQTPELAITYDIA
jgi:hypothetical protein